MEHNTDNAVKVLVFDLGGVVIDIDFDQVFLSWANDSKRSFEEIRSRFSFDHFYEAHQRGEISSKDYFAALRKTLGIDISDLQIENGWNSIYKGKMPEISEVLQVAKEKLPIYAFTNSDPTHQKTWSKRFAKTLSLFEAVFNSSDIGSRKPEPEAFQIIAESIGCKLHEMLLYDDSIENIIGAQQAGLHAVHVKSIFDIEHSLKSF